MESREFIDMARKIMNFDPRTRERGADEITDRLSAYSPAQASALATLLSANAVTERENSVLESQLHAVLELASTGHVDLNHISQLNDIQLDDLPPQLRGYVRDLLDT